MYKEIIKKKISEKNKANKNYLEKLELLKQSYGVEFSINSLKNNDIDTITFYNMDYQKTFKNITMIYSNKYKKFNYLFYDCCHEKEDKILNIHKLMDTLNKEKKLNLLMDEIYRINNEYKQELTKIERKYGIFNELYNTNVKELDISRKEKYE